MALPLLGTNAQIIRTVEALFGVQPGFVYYTNFQEFVASTDINTLANTLVAYSPASDSAENLATSVVSHYQVETAEISELLVEFVTAQLAATDPANWGEKIVEITELYSALENDAFIGASVTKFNQHVNASLNYSNNPLNADVAASASGPVIVLDLSTNQDNLTGSAANDAFTAFAVNNQNTLQSGDTITDASSVDVDSLYAEIGNSQDFALSVKTTNIEQIFLNARSDSTDSNDNNLGNNFVQVDAGDMQGVTEWGTVGSRADVVIEDIRIQDDEITKDITFSMHDTDPGSAAISNPAIGNEVIDNHSHDGTIANDSAAGASLHAYFDANSLRSTVVSNDGQFNIEILDIENHLLYQPVDADGNAVGDKIAADQTVGSTAFNASQSLKEDTNDGFVFVVTQDGVATTINIINDGTDVNNIPNNTTGISGASTYGELRDALQYAFDNNQVLQALVGFDTNKYTIAEAGTFQRDYKFSDPLVTGAATGTTINVSFSDIRTDQLSFVEWTPAKVVQFPSTNIAADIKIGDPTVDTQELITANLILDNVGRGSEGGDAEIGTMSTRGGVEQLDIKVEDTSWVTNVRSTNNALEVVTVQESEVARDTVTNTGNISTGALTIGSGLDQDNNNLVDYRVAPTHVATNGLVDVRIFNASAFVNELKIGATLSHNAIEKYLQIPSTNANPSIPTTDVDLTGESNDTSNFVYSLGTSNDYLNINLDSDLTADSDFTLTINGNAGDDNIQTVIDLENHNDILPTWQVAQAKLANLTIDSGTGNDTVSTLGAGNFIIRTQTGDDTVYADNTGNADQTVTSDITGLNGSFPKAVWTANNRAADDQISTLDTAATSSFTGINGQVTVTFKGITSQTIDITATNTGTAVQAHTDAYDVRQALKVAINSDPELSKLLVVKDGPANTFVIESLIDGVMNLADLNLNFTAKTLTAADITTGFTSFDSAAANLSYTEVFAQDDNGVDLIGADSTSISDNVINAGTNETTSFNATTGQYFNHDVIVLGTTDSGLNTGTSSNDTVEFTGTFGHDTIVNFVTNSVSSTGHDVLDFTAYTTDNRIDSYNTGIGSSLIDNSIILGNSTTVYSTAANTAAKGVLLVQQADANVMDVYALTSTTATTTVTKSALLGTIDLADVNVNSLTLADFQPVINVSTVTVATATVAYNAARALAVTLTAAATAAAADVSSVALATASQEAALAAQVAADAAKAAADALQVLTTATPETTDDADGATAVADATTVAAEALIAVTVADTAVANATAALTDTDAPVMTDVTVNYTENQLADAVIATASATDASTVTYSIDAAETNFAIDAATGTISLTTAGLTAAANDFETAPNAFDLVVTATDAAANATSATLTLNVTDVAEVVEIALGNGSIEDAAGDSFQYNAALAETDIISANITNFTADDAINVDDVYLAVTNMLFDTTGTNQINFAFGDTTDFTPSFTINIDVTDTALVADVETASAIDSTAVLTVLNTAWGTDWLI